MFKPLLTRRAANTTKKILDGDYTPTCMKDCDNLLEFEDTASTLTLKKGETYCFGLENNTLSYGPKTGTGFAIFDQVENSNIEITTYTYQCEQKNTSKYIFAAMTPNDEGRLFKLRSDTDQTVEFIYIPVTSYEYEFTDENDQKFIEKATFLFPLKNESTWYINSVYTITDVWRYYYSEYIFVSNPNKITITASNGENSVAVFSNTFDGINSNEEEIEDNYERKYGFIKSIPQNIELESSKYYVALSNITIKQNPLFAEDVVLPLLPDQIFTKGLPGGDILISNSNSNSKTGLIVGVVVGVVVVVAIVVFCVYWFACRSTSDDKEETPKV